MRPVIRFAALVALALLATIPAGHAGTVGERARNLTGNISADPGEALRLINQYRRQHGLAPLILDRTLTRAAQQHANDMAAHDMMSHQVSHGGLRQRMALAGIRPRLAAENVSAGYRNTGRAIAGWQNSPAHNRNLLLAKVRRMGLAAAYQPNSRYKYYWALIVAAD